MGHRAVTAASAGLVGAAVLAFDPGGLAPFGPVKWMLVPSLVLAGVAAAAGSGRMLVARHATLAWAAFLLWVALASALGAGGLLAWVGTHERRFGALTWLVCG